MIEYLIPNDPTHLKALLARDGIHNHIAMDANEMLAVQNRVFILPGGVDDLKCEILVPIADYFAEGVFDCWVIGVDEMAIDELDCEGGLAYAWAWSVELADALWGHVAYQQTCCRLQPFCASSVAVPWLRFNALVGMESLARQTSKW